jgi:hypothetical protein
MARPTTTISKSPHPIPLSNGARLFSGELPLPRSISAIELSRETEPTVITGLPASFFVYDAKFWPVPNSPSQYRRWEM